LTKLALAVFASGRGSNFSAILQSIENGALHADVRILISNNPEAGALVTASDYGIPVQVINKKDFASRTLFVDAMLSVLERHQVNFIALAGYMKKIPPEVIQKYENRILNIHPALLPSFGGKGMYGHFVHEAILETGCKISGVTVHLVDEHYDRGPIVAQRCVPVKENDNPDTLAARVLKEEHRLFAEALQFFAEERVEIKGRRVVIH